MPGSLFSSRWDHWLDTHIGVKYSGKAYFTGFDDEVKTDLQSTCLTEAEEVTTMLLDNQIPVGKRFIQSDGDHYYSGYSGLSMALEFNTECHYGDDGATDVCTCVSQNSDTLAVEQFGGEYTTCGLVYDLEDGHSGLTGPWSSTGSDGGDDDDSGGSGGGGGGGGDDGEGLSGGGDDDDGEQPESLAARASKSEPLRNFINGIGFGRQ